jgi:hypothetical protein
MAAVTMAPVHEQMHQGTGEQRQPHQQPQYVGLMFGEQQYAGDNQEPGQHKPNTEPQGYSLPHGPAAAGIVLH